MHVYEVLHNSDDATLLMREVTSFFIGCRVTGATWSPGTRYTGDSSSEPWRLEIVVATEVQELRLLQAMGPESSTSTNDLLGDTQVSINDVAWCMVPGYERYVAAAGEDGTLQIWDLEPEGSGPVCHELYFDAPLLSVAFHSKMPKLLFVMDGSGVGRFVDWLASIAPSASGSTDVRLAASITDPVTLSAYAAEHADVRGAGAWQPQDAGVVGALLGTHWCVWNVSSNGAARGAAAPEETGVVRGAEHLLQLPRGGSFRFSLTNPRLFAVSLPTLPGAAAATGVAPRSSGVAGVHVYDLALPTSPRQVDVHAQTPYWGVRPVLLNVTGTAEAGEPTVPAAYGVASLDWLPHRVGAYDVLLVGVGRLVVPIPA